MLDAMRGKLIVLCGIDGCGKSTIIEHLSAESGFNDNFAIMKHPPKEWYENKKVRAAYLDDVGEKIADEEELLLTYNLRKREEKEMISLLNGGKHLIFHRYIFSLFAYYVGMDKYELTDLIQYFGDLLLPDKVFYLKISEEEFYRRFEKKEQLSYQKNREYVKRVFHCYDILAEMYQWEIIDTEYGVIEESVGQVKKKINEMKIPQQYLNLKREKYE